jgi:hypothetical protein
VVHEPDDGMVVEELANIELGDDSEPDPGEHSKGEAPPIVLADILARVEHEIGSVIRLLKTGKDRARRAPGVVAAERSDKTAGTQEPRLRPRALPAPSGRRGARPLGASTMAGRGLPRNITFAREDASGKRAHPDL